MPVPLRIIPGLHRATHQVGLALERQGQPAMSQAEAHILAHIAACGGECTIAELHDALAHKRSTLTSVLDRLAERGWIGREPDARDRRSVLVRLTGSGRRAASAAYRALATIERRACEHLSGEDVAAVSRVLAALEHAAAASHLRSRVTR